MARGRVLKCARENVDNVISCANENPILDTRGYVVEFEDGEQAELAANTIYQSMYAQCDPDGNQYFMFDSIVEFRRSTTALCYADQKFLKADGRSLCAGPLLDGNCVFNGRMVPHRRRNCLTSKSHIILSVQSMVSHKVF